MAIRENKNLSRPRRPDPVTRIAQLEERLAQLEERLTATERAATESAAVKPRK